MHRVWRPYGSHCLKKADARRIFHISGDKDPVGIICVGYPEKPGAAPDRKGLADKVTYIE